MNTTHSAETPRTATTLDDVLQNLTILVPSTSAVRLTLNGVPQHRLALNGAPAPRLQWCGRRLERRLQALQPRSERRLAA